MARRILLSIASAALLVHLVGCATESHQTVPVEKTVAAATAYSGPRSPIVIGKFDNRSTYLRGLFSDGVDRLGGQAKTILLGHLQQTGRFDVMDRDNLDEMVREVKYSGKAQAIKGADFAVTGDVVEFGRKETGDEQLFGILGSGKKQVAYSKVTLNVLDVATSVDTRTGILLWEGRGIGQQKSASLSNPIATLIAAALTQAINTTTDNAHNVSRMANENLFAAKGTGLPYGPYSPKYRTAR